MLFKLNRYESLRPRSEMAARPECGLRGDLEDGAVGGRSGAIEIAGWVEDQLAFGLCAIRGACEGMEKSIVPTAASDRRELQDHATAVGFAVAAGEISAECRGRVDVAEGVDVWAGEWSFPIRSVGERVDESFVPAASGYGRKFEDRAEAKSAAKKGCAVDIAGSIDGDSVGRVPAIRAGECVDNCVVPGSGSFGRKLKYQAAAARPYRATAVNPAKFSVAVKVASRVESP